jgi:hypothetical protein
MNEQYSKGIIEGDKKQNGFVGAFKLQIIILNFVVCTIKLYKKQFKLKLMN